MKDPNFNIYSASAGSGKTYALAKEYLKLLLSNDSPIKFRQILAITFTNKAVGEMKTRILENLHAFGKDPLPKQQESLFNDLCNELSLDSTQLQQRSRLVLKRILHNYSFFEVSTIDKFNHKLLKTFARDLHLSQNFEVELDTDLLLEEAVGNLLERAGNDQELTQVLIDFSLEKIDEDKSWNIAFDLLEIGKLLFQENHAPHIEALRSKSIRDFKEIQKRMAVQMDGIEAKVVGDAKKVLQEIEVQGFDFADFPRQTLPNHFKKIIAGEFSTKILYNNQLEQNIAEGKLLKANDNRDVSQLANTVSEAFLSIKQNLYRRGYLRNIYGNLVPLTVLNEISKEIKNIELERDIIPISSFNSILSKEIKNQPVPFIYERMGEKYRHYFIDEFQDTSKMQWDNLVPLIGNALESENERQERGSLFLVGDVKQAIYRWRGGRAEQFLDLINGNSHPFVVEPTVHSLDTNWRSYDQIVEFNNSFFTTVAPVLENVAYRDLFLRDSHQKTNNKPGGFVQLTFLDKGVADKEEAHCHQVLKSIQEITSQGYPYSYISILVRDNSKGMLLADFMALQGIPLISSDALLLNNNEKVLFLMAILRVFENPQDLVAAYRILLHLSALKSNKHGIISEHLGQVAVFLSQEFGFDLDELKGQSVSSILEKAIVQFDLAQEATAYLTFLMDEALDVEKREGPSVHAFLKYWEVKKSTLSIAAPDNVNAIKIMTIHKSKGLEFPFVIFPFADALLDDKRKKKKIWVPASEHDKELALEELLLNANKDLLEYNPITASIYVDEEQKSFLDAMNVLYVALTRPVKGLYIITEEAKELDSLEDATSYADLFQGYLQVQGIPKNEQGIYTFGVFPKNGDATSAASANDHYIPYVTRPKDDLGFTISTTSGRLWDDGRKEAVDLGNLIHLALSKIKTAKDVPMVIQNLLLAGYFQQDLAKDIEQNIWAVVSHPDLKPYFSEGANIMNEQEILTTDGHSLRPDRIVLSGNRVTIVDYKTGKPSPSHKEQITQYADALKEMNLEIEHTIIVYIDQKINPVFV